MSSQKEELKQSGERRILCSRANLLSQVRVRCFAGLSLTKSSTTLFHHALHELDAFF
jgi:hypothetical protein